MSEKKFLPGRVAAFHDLSCFGRCALTVILPTLSALGVQVVPIPTALLSTHTGGFTDLHFRDLSGDIDEIAAHFDRLSLTFDAVYSGFLGSEEQIGKVEAFIDRFGAGGVPVLVDPVMGDDGELYSTYTPELVEGMKRLCRKADILTPNYTEACILAGEPYQSTAEMREDEIMAIGERLLDRLLAYGAKQIVITGLPCGDELLIFGCSEEGRFCHRERLLHAGYPGTGDLFASVLLGLLLDGNGFQSAAMGAAEITTIAIEKTMCAGTPVRDGVLLERCMYEMFALKTGMRRWRQGR